jgi:hypothetical protein
LMHSSISCVIFWSSHSRSLNMILCVCRYWWVCCQRSTSMPGALQEHKREFHLSRWKASKFLTLWHCGSNCR